MKGSRSWLLLCALHGVASMLLWWAPASTLEALTWHADDGLQHPWTLWTSAWVHLNTPHLIANQLALGALTAFAWIVRPPLTSTLAWLLAWPLMQLSLLLWPQIGYAAGLAGVLHAGAVVLAVQLLRRRIQVPKAQRWGALLALGLLTKLGLERGWDYPVVWDSANDMSTVQAAHLAGAFWGLWLGMVTSWLPAPQARSPGAGPTAPQVTESIHP